MVVSKHWNRLSRKVVQLAYLEIPGTLCARPRAAIPSIKIGSPLSKNSGEMTSKSHF